MNNLKINVRATYEQYLKPSIGLSFDDAMKMITVLDDDTPADVVTKLKKTRP